MAQNATGILLKDGQVTIPEEFRQILGLHEGDAVVMRLQADEILIRRPRYTLETAFGAVPPLPDRDEGDFDDLIEEAMQDHADWVVDRMRRGLE